jgi:hypothetical protein
MAVAASGQNSSILAYSVPPRASQAVPLDGTMQDVVTGSVRIAPADTATPVAQVVFSFKPGGSITVSEAGVPSTSGNAFRIYVEAVGTFGQPGSIQSGLAVANNTPRAATITFELTNLDGSNIGLPQPPSRGVPAFGHVVHFIGDLFPGLPQAFKGIVRVSSASDIAVIGLRSRYNERGDFLITTTPPASETQPHGDLVMPHLADGAGYTTQFIIISGAGASSGVLQTIHNSGQPLGATLK